MKQEEETKSASTDRVSSHEVENNTEKQTGNKKVGYLGQSHSNSSSINAVHFGSFMFVIYVAFRFYRGRGGVKENRV
jgi:hypothetical protein